MITDLNLPIREAEDALRRFFPNDWLERLLDLVERRRRRRGQ